MDPTLSFLNPMKVKVFRGPTRMHYELVRFFAYSCLSRGRRKQLKHRDDRYVDRGLLGLDMNNLPSVLLSAYTANYVEACSAVYAIHPRWAVRIPAEMSTVSFNEIGLVLLPVERFAP